jgi:hypothetical protein
MTDAAKSIASTNSLLADRSAAAAASAAREAMLAANMAMKPGRAENVLAHIIRRVQTETKTGSRHEVTIAHEGVQIAMAGLGGTAKYALAAANATRYAADAAEAAGARRVANRARRAARDATNWAEVAQYSADTSRYSPYTALMTAGAARRAASAAVRAACAAGPLGHCVTQIVGLAGALLPRVSRERYREEWKSDLCYMPRSRVRARYVLSILPCAVRLAIVLRTPAGRSSG